LIGIASVGSRIRALAYVADDCEGLPAGRLDLRRGRVNRPRQAWVRGVGLGHQHDVAAPPADFRGDREPDASTAAGHEQCPARESGRWSGLRVEVAGSLSI
jgi:hypothetical protein